MVQGALGVADKDGIELDAQVGDRENDVQVGKGIKGTGEVKARDNATVNVNTSNKETASEVGTAETVNVKNENIPPWVFLISLAGWMLPSPIEIWRLVTKLFKKSEKV